MPVSAAQLTAVVQVQGADTAKSTLGDVGKSADSVQQGFGQMLKQGLASAAGFAIFNVGAKAVGFLKNQFADTISVAMQHQQIMTQTAEAIKSTGDASGMTAQQISDLALSLSKTTTFSDDTTQAAENLLLTFTGIGKKTFPEATETALDMATALKEGPTQAAMMLGKALNDPTTGLTALTRVGVTFSDQEKEQIKTMMAHNDVAGAQAVMLKELQTEFGGSAKAAGQTFGGQLQILKNNILDVKQQIGGALLPILGQMLSTVSGAVMPILQNFGNWFANTAAPAIQNFGHVVSGVFASVGHYLSLFDLTPITYAWKQFTGAVQELLAPLNSSSDIMGMLAPHLVDMRNLFSQLLVSGIRDVAGFITNVSNAVKGFAESINVENISSFSNSFKQLGPPIQNIIGLLGGQFKETLSFIGTSFKAIGDWIKTSVAPAVTSALPGFAQLGAALLNIVPFLLQVREVGMQLIEGFLTHVAPILGLIIPPLIHFAGILAGALATGINTIVTVGSALLTFFTKTQLGGDLVKATLIALSIPVGILALAFISLAVDAIAGFILSIPAMVAGFLAGAAGAWAMASGVIAATWPILAIIAVIALVILAIQHWGQIVDWLKGIWGAVASWFSGILTDVKVWFTWLWTTIQADTFKAWQAIQNFLKGALKAVLDIVLGPIYAIVDGFIWLYNHNYYFKDLVDAIVNFFKGCFSWLQGAWTDTINWLVGLWTGLVDYTTVLWDNISMQIKIGFERSIIFVQNTWNTIASFFINAWNTYIAGPLVALWTNVSTFFSNAWNNYIARPLTAVWQNVSNFFSNIWSNYIAGPIGNLWNQISGVIGSWSTKAVEWGANLIKGFVQGIINSANSVAGAVGGIAGKVLAFLGFHSPTKEGPGQEADQWAPNFVKMYVQGLESGIPKIQNIVSQLAKPIALSMSPMNNPSLAMPVGASGIPSSISQSASTGSGQPLIINVSIAGQNVGQVLLPSLTSAIRYGVGGLGI